MRDQIYVCHICQCINVVREWETRTSPHERKQQSGWLQGGSAALQNTKTFHLQFQLRLSTINYEFSMNVLIAINHDYIF